MSCSWVIVSDWFDSTALGADVSSSSVAPRLALAKSLSVHCLCISTQIIHQTWRIRHELVKRSFHRPTRRVTGCGRQPGSACLPLLGFHHWPHHLPRAGQDAPHPPPARWAQPRQTRALRAQGAQTPKPQACAADPVGRRHHRAGARSHPPLCAHRHRPRLGHGLCRGLAKPSMPASAFDQTLARFGLTHAFTYSKRPKTNAHAERFDRTLQEQFTIA